MGIVIVNRHEPEHEVADRLLALAADKGHDNRSVEAVRGEHDAALSFRVPDDVAEEFNADRADRWPDKIENDAKTADDQDGPQPAGVDEDAVAATNQQTAHAARAANTEETTPARRGAKAKE